jgi:hypothetical protein
MTLLRDLVICNSSGVPDGTADGQYLRWNASTGEWQLVNVIPVGDVDLTGDVSIGGTLSVAERISSPKGVTTDGRAINMGLLTWYAMQPLPNYTIGIFILYRHELPNPRMGLWLFRRDIADIYLEEIQPIHDTEIRSSGNRIEFRFTAGGTGMWYWAAQLIVWGA